MFWSFYKIVKRKDFSYFRLVFLRVDEVMSRDIDNFVNGGFFCYQLGM